MFHYSASITPPNRTMGIFKEGKGRGLSLRERRRGCRQGNKPCCGPRGPAGKLQIKFFLKGSVIKSNFNPSSQTARKNIQLSQTNDTSVFSPTCFPSESNYYRYLCKQKQSYGMCIFDSVYGLFLCHHPTPSPFSQKHQTACLQTQTRTKGQISIFPLCARLIENQKVTFQMSCQARHCINCLSFPISIGKRKIFERLAWSPGKQIHNERREERNEGGF